MKYTFVGSVETSTNLDLHLFVGSTATSCFLPPAGALDLTSKTDPGALEGAGALEVPDALEGDLESAGALEGPDALEGLGALEFPHALEGLGALELPDALDFPCKTDPS